MGSKGRAGASADAGRRPRALATTTPAAAASGTASANGGGSEVLTRTQAAALAGVHPTTIRRWEQKGVLTPVSNGNGGRSTQLRRSEVLAAAGLTPEPPPEPSAEDAPSGIADPPLRVVLPAAEPPRANGSMRAPPRRRRTRVRGFRVLAVMAVAVAAAATGAVAGRLTSDDSNSRAAEVFSPPGQVCLASWYEAGDTTASGQPFDPRGFTAASRFIPLGTRVVVTDLVRNRSVIVRINDRGPYVAGRCIDLSRRAFSMLWPLEMGIGPARVEILQHTDSSPLELLSDVGEPRPKE